MKGTLKDMKKSTKYIIVILIAVIIVGTIIGTVVAIGSKGKDPIVTIVTTADGKIDPITTTTDKGKDPATTTEKGEPDPATTTEDSSEPTTTEKDEEPATTTENTPETEPVTTTKDDPVTTTKKDPVTEPVTTKKPDTPVVPVVTTKEPEETRNPSGYIRLPRDPNPNYPEANHTHNYVFLYTEADGYCGNYRNVYQCSICNVKQYRDFETYDTCLDHQDEWILIEAVEATYGGRGYKAWRCPYCGYTNYTDEQEPLEYTHDFRNLEVASYGTANKTTDRYVIYGCGSEVCPEHSYACVFIDDKGNKKYIFDIGSDDNDLSKYPGLSKDIDGDNVGFTIRDERYAICNIDSCWDKVAVGRVDASGKKCTVYWHDENGNEHSFVWEAGKTINKFGTGSIDSNAVLHIRSDNTTYFTFGHVSGIYENN